MTPHSYAVDMIHTAKKKTKAALCAGSLCSHFLSNNAGCITSSANAIGTKMLEPHEFPIFMIYVIRSQPRPRT